MSGYEVVPDALRKTNTQLREAAELWDKAFKALEATRMEQSTMGVVGRMAGVPDTYNEALDIILDKLMIGKKSIEGAAEELNAVACDYEERDYEYYRKFGYMLE